MNTLQSWRQWGWAVAAPMVLAAPLRAEEDPPKESKSLTVVVRSDDDDSSKVLDQVRAQLKSSGISKEAQEKILKQVSEAMQNASKAKVEINKAKVATAKAGSAAAQAAAEAGKAAAEAASEIATIVVRGHQGEDGKAGAEARVLRIEGTKLQALKEKLPEMIQGRVLEGMNVGGPKYRIGIFLTQTVEESHSHKDHGDDEDEDEGDDDEDDEDEDMDNDQESHRSETLVIEEVMEDSPASKAGIQSGDVVTLVNGMPIKEVGELQEAVQESGKAGKPLEITLQRSGESMIVEVKPTKDEESDVEVMNLDLKLLPNNGLWMGQGFIVGEDENAAQTWMQKLPKGASALMMKSNDDSVKNELQELRKEIAELKMMILKMSDKD